MNGQNRTGQNNSVAGLNGKLDDTFWCRKCQALGHQPGIDCPNSVTQAWEQLFAAVLTCRMHAMVLGDQVQSFQNLLHLAFRSTVSNSGAVMFRPGGWSPERKVQLDSTLHMSELWEPLYALCKSMLVKTIGPRRRAVLLCLKLNTACAYTQIRQLHWIAGSASNSIASFVTDCQPACL